MMSPNMFQPVARNQLITPVANLQTAAFHGFHMDMSTKSLNHNRTKNRTTLSNTYIEEITPLIAPMTKNPAWKKCETDKKAADEARGCKIIPTGIGSDYIRFCKDKKPEVVEVKSGAGRLTIPQKITKATVTKIGFDYVEERCD